MSVNKMIDLYVSYGLSENTWNMLYDMTCHNLISRSKWEKFFETCKSWVIEGNRIIDSYTGEDVYCTDKDGFWKKIIRR